MIILFYIKSFLSKLETVLGSEHFLLAAVILAFFIKFYLVTKLLSYQTKSKKAHSSLVLLVIVLVSIILADSAWILKLMRSLFFPSIDYKYLLFWIRITWGFATVQYHGLALFIESLIKRKNIYNLRQQIFLPITGVLSIFFFTIAFIEFNNPLNRPAIEFKIFDFVLIYELYALMLLSIIVTLFQLRKAKIPKILKKQIKIFIWALMIPHLATELINFYPFNVLHGLLHHKLALYSISEILITCAIFYSIKKVMCLRFLNIEDPQLSKKGFNFIHDFRTILEQFSYVTSTKELGHIAQSFFKDAFHIPKQKTYLHIKNINNAKIQEGYDSTGDYNQSVIEEFISVNNETSEIGKLFIKRKIFLRDDLEFSNFYEEDEAIKKIISFLNTINAEIFIPIYDKGKLIAYILVKKHVKVKHPHKKSEFFSIIEKDQMVLFANYLGNIIKLIQNRNLKTLIRKEKELKEELYSKHQEINQYKESIRSLLNKNKDKKIGIIFYKGRQFIFGNQVAKNLIPININSHEGHPITKALKEIANQVIKYKSPQTSFINDTEGNKLVIYGIQNIEKDHVIIAIHYPEISDIITKHIHILKDPTKWDYLLYLETTESGKLINQLVPGNGETLLSFKIELLKIALSKKAILLDMAQQDLMPTVEILHHISLKEKLHVLDLQKPTTGFDTVIKLFGINHIFQMEEKRKPLLEELNKIGTLFIKNIQFLDAETQKHLAEFIRYGFYKPFKGEETSSSNVRIICSTNINLKQTVQDGTFSQHLFNELKKTSLSMPPLMTLPESELTNLTSGFTEQAIKYNEFKHIFELTHTEKKKIATSKPASLQELKKRVEKLLEKKSKTHETYKEIEFEPAHSLTDPEIIEAARLGKYALRDPQIMEMLWKKFKNQNKIATILGVNRSSVNRRCKDYNLQ